MEGVAVDDTIEHVLRRDVGWMLQAWRASA
jgi:hypothetical protein